ncbi:putative monovalent cation/H+ antiporter subunit E [Mycolicibacterium conceptionense]|uniref:Cation:proton antiporter n=1 Tax=Mycolicibacterium conceptionense TaxID=451644 RepID=A0A0U1D7H0_9MYCO|nr:Na+/H+ antiporter subunit E [Mycolicibacterium conceptionense]ORV22166.1 cation:proton antiporter [Mycolicibacterium conceptionense]CQD09686.1 putative monovalent cation/H+ antiporter subunit E [Mycolicibacterium conceptionense]
MRWLLLRAWILCWLMLVWVLLWGSFSVANIVSGLAVAVVITVLLPLPAVPVEGRVHLLSLARLVIRVAVWLVMSSFQMAWLAVKPGPLPVNAVLRAHLAVKSDLVLALGVNVINLTPGTIVLEIDQTRRLIYVHVVDVGSERAIHRFHNQMTTLQRLLVAAFERESDWRPVVNKEGA